MLIKKVVGIDFFLRLFNYVHGSRVLKHDSGHQKRFFSRRERRAQG